MSLDYSQVSRQLQDSIETSCANETFDEAECTDAINEIVDAIAGELSVPKAASDAVWMIVAGALVFFMHAGFSMLESGSVRKPNVINIMFKNVSTVTIGAIVYWLLGFGFAYGATSDPNSFIGNNRFAFEFDNDSVEDAAFFFFQFTFAATAATIVSGAVAERITLYAYFFVAALLTGFVFPVVTHWVWSNDGFMSAFNADGNLIEGSIGLIDFAGSGVVHATGGLIALVGAWVIKPRKGKYVDGEAQSLPVSSHTLQTLGTFILWFGWFGFNCGSTLVFDGTNSAKAALTTTLSACGAGVVATVYSRVARGYYDLPMLLNCVLAGLVGITAGCVAVFDFTAPIIGAIAALVYIGGANLIEKVGIDDPIGAAPVHGFAGIWGVLAVGIFLDEDAVSDSYGAVPGRGAQFAMQFLGALIISAWALTWGAILFFGLKTVNVLRLEESVEDEGIDASEHGGAQAVHF